MDWIAEARRVRALYADGNPSSALVAEAALLRAFAAAVAADSLDDARGVARLLEAELLTHDRLGLVTQRRVAQAEAWRNEVQIRGGPRDGELVSYVGVTLVDGGEVYDYRRIQHDLGGSSHRYVLR